MQITNVIFHSLGWQWPEFTVLMQLTQVSCHSLNWNPIWIHCSRTSQKLRVSQLPNQHGTTWAVTSTGQLGNCFWQCRYKLRFFPNRNELWTWNKKTILHLLKVILRVGMQYYTWHIRKTLLSALNSYLHFLITKMSPTFNCQKNLTFHEVGQMSKDENAKKKIRNIFLQVCFKWIWVLCI